MGNFTATGTPVASASADSDTGSRPDLSKWQVDDPFGLEPQWPSEKLGAYRPFTKGEMSVVDSMATSKDGGFVED